ncbi:alpha-amylase [Actinomyces sp. MRS3W]|uniref:alpha-amylase n=1 Tax=Actinomyces sp. MRS3W TaxID=2800796 RepID=UPI0028FDB16B|nr:alpha-amylase [Actinomyces sp. MRS3W]MDU0348828.1 alpha-amylase [Actinomyces sp. MRS3W]
MNVNPPVLMPVWMAVVGVVGLIVAAAIILRAFLVTRRDTARSVGDIPMAATERGQWISRVDDAAARYRRHELDLRGLHLELASALRGFATARSGEDLVSATVLEILDMADTTGPRSIMERLRRVRSSRRPLDVNPLGHVGELLAVWEQPSFDRDPDAAAESAINQAREVVTRW